MKYEHESKQCFAIAFESVGSFVVTEELFPSSGVCASYLDVNRLVSCGESCQVITVCPDPDRIIVSIRERGRGRAEQFLFRHTLLDHHPGELEGQGRRCGS